MSGQQVRLEINVLEEETKKFVNVVFDSDDSLYKVLNWLEEQGERSVVKRILSQENELIDVTICKERILNEWEKTLQVHGLWPSAILEIRPVNVEMRIRAGQEEVKIWIRRHYTIAHVADIAFQALSPQALPKVQAKRSRECRLVVAGTVLEDFDSYISDTILWERLDAILISPRNEGGESEKKKMPSESRYTQVRCCRICFEEEIFTMSQTTGEDEVEIHTASQQIEERVWIILKDSMTAIYKAIFQAENANHRSELFRKARESIRKIFSWSKGEHKLISPCLCDGSMRWVHIDCLNSWRAAAPTSRSLFRCDQCGYQYQVRRAAIASFLTSDLGALSFAFCFLACFISLAGNFALSTISKSSRRQLYSVWLRLPPRVIPKTYNAEVFMLGSVSLGLCAFALYAFDVVLTTHILHIRLGLPFRLASEHLLILSAWIVAETYELKRARAIAVVGLLFAIQAIFFISMRLARLFTTRFADRILDIAPHLRKRHNSPRVATSSSSQ